VKKIVATLFWVLLVVGIVFINKSVADTLETSVTTSEYPKIDVSGYKKWLYSDIKVDPQINYSLYATTNEAFRSPKLYSKLMDCYIEGNLLKNSSVKYNVFQSPLAPDFYSVYLDYDNYYLSFGNQTDYLIYKNLILHDFASGVGVGATFDKFKLYYLTSATYPEQYVTSNFKNYNTFKSPSYNGRKIKDYMMMIKT